MGNTIGVHRRTPDLDALESAVNSGGASDATAATVNAGAAGGGARLLLWSVSTDRHENVKGVDVATFAEFGMYRSYILLLLRTARGGGAGAAVVAEGEGNGDGDGDGDSKMSLRTLVRSIRSNLELPASATAGDAAATMPSIVHHSNGTSDGGGGGGAACWYDIVVLHGAESNVFVRSTAVTKAFSLNVMLSSQRRGADVLSALCGLGASDFVLLQSVYNIDTQNDGGGGGGSSSSSSSRGGGDGARRGSSGDVIVDQLMTLFSDRLNVSGRAGGGSNALSATDGGGGGASAVALADDSSQLVRSMGLKDFYQFTRAGAASSDADNSAGGVGVGGGGGGEDGDDTYGVVAAAAASARLGWYNFAPVRLTPEDVQLGIVGGKRARGVVAAGSVAKVARLDDVDVNDNQYIADRMSPGLRRPAGGQRNSQPALSLNLASLTKQRDEATTTTLKKASESAGSGGAKKKTMTKKPLFVPAVKLGALSGGKKGAAAGTGGGDSDSDSSSDSDGSDYSTTETSATSGTSTPGSQRQSPGHNAQLGNVRSPRSLSTPELPKFGLGLNLSKISSGGGGSDTGAAKQSKAGGKKGFSLALGTTGGGGGETSKSNGGGGGGSGGKGHGRKQLGVGLSLRNLRHDAYNESLPEEYDESRAPDAGSMVKMFEPILSQINHNLFLSSRVPSQNLELLTKHGVTHVLNCAGDVCESMWPDTLTYVTLYLGDGNVEDISCLFNEVLEYYERVYGIDISGDDIPPTTAYEVGDDGAVGGDTIGAGAAAGSVAQNSNKLLVHCHAGVSRSSSMIVLYMMRRNKWSFGATHEYIKARRRVANPNTGFLSQLLVYNKELKRLRAGTPGANVLYRIVRHSRRLVVMKKCRAVSSKYIDRRFPYVLAADDAVYYWFGADATADLRYGTPRTIYLLLKYSFARGKRVVFVTHGGEAYDVAWDMHADVPADSAAKYNCVALTRAVDSDAAFMRFWELLGGMPDGVDTQEHDDYNFDAAKNKKQRQLYMDANGGNDLLDFSARLAVMYPMLMVAEAAAEAEEKEPVAKKVVVVGGGKAKSMRSPKLSKRSKSGRLRVSTKAKDSPLSPKKKHKRSKSEKATTSASSSSAAAADLGANGTATSSGGSSSGRRSKNKTPRASDAVSPRARKSGSKRKHRSLKSKSKA